MTADRKVIYPASPGTSIAASDDVQVLLARWRPTGKAGNEFLRLLVDPDYHPIHVHYVPPCSATTFSNGFLAVIACSLPHPADARATPNVRSREANFVAARYGPAGCRGGSNRVAGCDDLITRRDRQASAPCRVGSPVAHQIRMRPSAVNGLPSSAQSRSAPDAGAPGQVGSGHAAPGRSGLNEPSPVSR